MKTLYFALAGLLLCSSQASSQANAFTFGSLNLEINQYDTHPHALPDLNKASFHDLLLIPNIGDTKAYIIFDMIDDTGGLTSYSQLRDIPGLSDSSLMNVCQRYNIYPPLQTAEVKIKAIEDEETLIIE
ncbi:MAG: helix-hairpin-helix domain-containing protein [Gammaproteobacteria bacterium]|nr:helix-hairpin-helix domain-containing protein [Gammaproteobacteria bacterium]